MYSKLFSAMMMIGSFAHAGGIHDGGGQLVRMKNGVAIADVYRPKEGKAPFVPAGVEAIDLQKRFPEAIKEVKELSKLYRAYTSEWQRPELINLVYNDLDPKAYQYYLVDKLPDTADCRQSRDNTGVPAMAVVAHAACTRGQVTLLLDSGENAFSRLPANVQAGILGHEGFRHVEPLMETGTIEAVIGGLTTAREILEQQRHGSRSKLTEVQTEILNDMLAELRRAGTRGGYGDRDRVFENGGGLALVGQVGKNLFVGIGSEIWGFNVIGDDVTILESNVRAHWEIQDAIIGNGVTIERSDVSSPYLAKYQMHLQNGVQIKDSMIYGSLAVGTNSKIEKLRAGSESTFMTIGTNVRISNSELLDLNYANNRSFMTIGDDVTITDSKMLKISEAIPGSREEISLTVGPASAIRKSNIDFSRSFEAGAGVTVNGLKLRVRAFDLNGRWATNSNVKVANASVIESDGTPVVLFAESGLLASTSEVRLAGKLNLVNTPQTCTMKADPKTRTESGVVIQSLDLISLDQLSNCKISAPVSERECVNLESCNPEHKKPECRGGQL